MIGIKKTIHEKIQVIELHIRTFEDASGFLALRFGFILRETLTVEEESPMSYSQRDCVK